MLKINAFLFLLLIILPDFVVAQIHRPNQAQSLVCPGKPPLLQNEKLVKKNSFVYRLQKKAENWHSQAFWTLF